MAAAALLAGVLLAGCTGQSAPGSVPDVSTPSVSLPAGTPASVPPTPTLHATQSPVPQPTPGSVRETVPAGQVTYATPVEMTKKTSWKALSVEVASLTSLTASAKLPGEVSGPALKVTLRVTNGLSKAVALDGVTVTLADSTGRPGGEILGAPTRTFGGSVGPGKSASADYVFTVPTSRRTKVRIEVVIPEVPPVLVFEGAAP